MEYLLPRNWCRVGGRSHAVSIGTCEICRLKQQKLAKRSMVYQRQFHLGTRVCRGHGQTSPRYQLYGITRCDVQWWSIASSVTPLFLERRLFYVKNCIREFSSVSGFSIETMWPLFRIVL